MANKIEINKHIPQAQWLKFFDQFSTGNRGRHVAIEIADQEAGDLELIKNAPLFGIVYDPVGKGNSLIIETGQDQVFYAHTVDDPTEVWTGQDANGLIQAIQITDKNKSNTIVKLKE